MRVRVRSYQNLTVWQRSIELVVATYRASAGFPREERFGLTSQVRRAATSVATNIAEGHERLHRGDFIRHLSFARGSLAETETLLHIAERLDFVPESETCDVWSFAGETGAMLTAMMRKLSPDARSAYASSRSRDARRPTLDARR